MAKYIVTCPKCGTVNEAATGLFAKKTVKCARCGFEIDAQVARKAAKKCPECGKITMVDEAKVKNGKVVLKRTIIPFTVPTGI